MCCTAFVLLSSLIASAASAVPSSGGSCQALLELGEKLSSADDAEARSRGMARLREAEVTCAGEGVEPEVRALALLLLTRLHDDDSELQARMRADAVRLLREEAPDGALLPRALDAVADSAMVAGRYEEGIALGFESLAERERIFGGRSREYVEGLVWVAVAYKSAAGDRKDADPELAKALDHSERAVELARRLFGPHDRATIRASVDLVDSLTRVGRIEEANRLQDAIGPYVERLD